VARWTGRLGYDGPDNLRRAAVMLALASLRSEPNLRAEQAAQWALRKRWLGVDEAGRAMIAMAVLANSGQADIQPNCPVWRLCRMRGGDLGHGHAPGRGCAGR
jgi:exopolyphosphatase/guanosine-5'-triphosphate,3'-diphosphate pyrophosphatase